MVAERVGPGSRNDAVGQSLRYHAKQHAIVTSQASGYHLSQPCNDASTDQVGWLCLLAGIHTPAVAVLIGRQ
jgi:hypothetical protein